MAFTITYTTETCGRCGGSGHYSYNQKDGTVCYGCSGRTTRLTKAAKKAQAAIEAFKKEHFSVAIETVVAGDRIVYDGKARTVTAVERRGHAFGHTVAGETVWEDGITVTFAKPIASQFGAYSSVGMAASAVVQKAVTGADWDAVVAFARTLKGKGFTITEQS